MAEGNGSPVTWRELNLVVEPIKEDVAEIRKDVKSLLGGQARAEGVEIATNEDKVNARAWLPPLLAAVISAGISLPAYFH